VSGFIDIRTLSEQVSALEQDVRDSISSYEQFRVLLVEQRDAIRKQDEQLKKLVVLLRKLAIHLSLPRLD